MAADQERNARIAKALGLELDIHEGIGRIHWHAPDVLLPVYMKEIDFSTPEWQIKIQERVRKKCERVTYDYVQGGSHYLSVLPREGKNPRSEDFDAVTAAEVWTDALLWLAERKVKHESNS